MLVTPTRDGTRPGYYGPDEGHENDPGHGSNATTSSNNNQGAVTSDAGWENVQSPESFNPTGWQTADNTKYITHGGETWQGKTTKEVKQAIKERQKTQPKKEINWQNIKETINPFSRKKYFNWATSIPGSKKRITNYRNKYAEYLESLGINPSPELLDTDNLYSFFDKQAFEKNLKPTQYGMDAPMSYGDFIAERFGAPGVKYSGNVGNLEKYVKTRDDDGKPLTYGYKEKTGGDGGGQQPSYDPAYLAWLKSQQDGTGVVEEEVVEEGGGGTGSGILYPYKDYGTANYPTSSTFQSYLARGGRVPAAFGGIMDTGTGRRAYGLGSIFKSITKPFKGIAKAAGKVLKSPVGLAALGYFAPAAFGKGVGFSGWNELIPKQGMMAKLFRKPTLDATGKIIKGADYGDISGLKAFTTLSPLLAFTDLAKASKQESLGMTKRGGKLVDPLTGQESIPGGMRQTLNDALADAWDEGEQAYDAAKMSTIKQAYPFLGQYPTFQVARDGGRIGFKYGKEVEKSDVGNMEGLLSNITQEQVDADPDKYAQLLIGLRKPDRVTGKHGSQRAWFNQPGGGSISVPWGWSYEGAGKDYFQFLNFKDGGRIPAQEGGLMDLGGMEKDYRNEGGFVALGGEERADDVPARLSRNEFVFTADAVRNAGGGDIDKGAEIMENVMKNLEQGGKISEETQGNTGAQEMFSVSERIGEVL